MEKCGGGGASLIPSSAQHPLESDHLGTSLHVSLVLSTMNPLSAYPHRRADLLAARIGGFLIRSALRPLCRMDKHVRAASCASWLERRRSLPDSNPLRSGRGISSFPKVLYSGLSGVDYSRALDKASSPM